MRHRAKFHIDSSIGSKVIPKKHRYHFYQKQCHKPFYERAKNREGEIVLVNANQNSTFRNSFSAVIVIVSEACSSDA
jgi:hypothetical protein